MPLSEGQSTLFEAVGGERAVTAAVDKLYERAMEDPLLQVYFESAMVPALKPRVARYLTFLFDGASSYEGPTIHQAHVGKDVTDLAFDAFVAALVEAFTQLQVGFAEVAEIRRRVKDPDVAREIEDFLAGGEMLSKRTYDLLVVIAAGVIMQNPS